MFDTKEMELHWKEGKEMENETKINNLWGAPTAARTCLELRVAFAAVSASSHGPTRKPEVGTAALLVFRFCLCRTVVWKRGLLSRIERRI